MTTRSPAGIHLDTVLTHIRTQWQNAVVLRETRSRSADVRRNSRDGRLEQHLADQVTSGLYRQAHDKGLMILHMTAPGWIGETDEYGDVFGVEALAVPGLTAVAGAG